MLELDRASTSNNGETSEMSCLENKTMENHLSNPHKLFEEWDNQTASAADLTDDDSGIESDNCEDKEQCDVFIPTPKTTAVRADQTPSSVLIAGTTNGQASLRLLRVPFDGGGTAAMTH